MVSTGQCRPIGKQCVLIVAAIASIVDGASQSARFFASPWRANEGDEVRFQTIGLTNSPTQQVLGWRWDFNGDGVTDLEGAGLNHPEGLAASWFATLDPALTRDGFQSVTPTLTLVVTNAGQAHLTTIGPLTMTEHLYGPADTINREIVLVARGSGNADLALRVTASPRLIELKETETNKFFAEVTIRNPNVVGTPEIKWRFGDQSSYAEGQFDTNGAAPRHRYLEANSYTVETHVNYQLRLPSGIVTNDTLIRTNRDLVTVVQTSEFLSRGRGYRRGFPSEYDWDDIVKAYGVEGANGDRYTYYHHFQRAYQSAQTNYPHPVGRTNLTLAINELLQGQNLLGNKRLVEALRIKYPRLTSPGEDSGERLPEPPGVREETKAIDVALLDFQAGISMAFEAFREYGTNVFRSRAERGREPFPEFPGYVSFVDPMLSEVPIPIKNELWQLSGALEKEALGTMEKAKKLFRLSVSDSTLRPEAKEECKKAGLRGYLGMAVLAAAQSPQDFVANQGNDLLAHVKNARDLFEQINAGLNPVGNDGSFIPNESFAAIQHDAQKAVADARESEIRAREEDRTFERYQADLRNELQSQRAAFITPLKNLTGFDPQDYHNLQTYDDQLDYRSTIRSRLSLIRSGVLGPSGFGELGLAVANELDAQLGIDIAQRTVSDIAQTVRDAKWANTRINGVISGTAFEVRALDLAQGILTGILNKGGEGNPNTGALAAGIASGVISAEKTGLRALQTSSINDVILERDIRKLLLDQAQAAMAVRRAERAKLSAELNTERLLSQMDRLIEDLANARDTAANLYFQDPSFRVVVSRAQRRAEAELDFAIDRLYRLAKTLEYEWTEAYKNPISVPVDSSEPLDLDPLFDKFGTLEDLFIVRTADEAKDYLGALSAWNSKLLRISPNGISVRGPNHAGPITAEPISLREDILGLRPDAERSLELSVQQFRDYLKSRLQTNRFNLLNPSLEVEFSTGIADNSLFPATGSRWNMRIASISIDLVGESGLSRKQVAEVDLALSGMATLRRFFAKPPEADDLFHLTFNLGRRERSAHGIVVPARINGATGGRPPAEFAALGLRNRPIAATRWVLRLDTENPSNSDLDFRKLKDIILRFTYTYGNPPEFPGF